ncbi:MAG: hypothetical protein DWQ02_19195, partial [Bacteroidetes bacterium]
VLIMIVYLRYLVSFFHLSEFIEIYKNPLLFTTFNLKLTTFNFQLVPNFYKWIFARISSTPKFDIQPSLIKEKIHLSNFTPPAGYIGV